MLSAPLCCVITNERTNGIMKKKVLSALMAIAVVAGTAGAFPTVSVPAIGSVTASAADSAQLEDGLYKMNIEMIKADHSGYSMSNNAVDNTVTLEVTGGKCYITVEFKGLAIEDKFGYLKTLNYYDEGYTYGKWGKLQGDVKGAEVLSYYNGIVDSYNDIDTPYPHMMKFPLVDGKDLDEDGEQYVPLQVFVPIMDAISSGSGTQDVLMSLNWDSLEKKETDLAGSSLSVSGDITMNNYIELSDEVLNDSDAMVVSTVNGFTTETAVSSAKNTENGYQFAVNVPAKDMTSDVTIQVVNGKGEVLDTYTVSVEEYAMNIVYGDYSDKQKKAAKALLNYGAYAQTFFGTNIDNLANANLSEEDKSLASVTDASFADYGVATNGSLPENVNYEGSALSLASETAIKHYFRTTRISELTFTVNGKTVEPVSTGKKNQYYVPIAGISAPNLATQYEVIVSDGIKNYTMKYSAMDYCKEAQTANVTNADALKDVTKALYLFYQSTK